MNEREKHRMIDGLIETNGTGRKSFHNKKSLRKIGVPRMNALTPREMRRLEEQEERREQRRASRKGAKSENKKRKE